MKKKFIAITIFLLFLISILNSSLITAQVKKNYNTNEKVTVYLNNFNEQKPTLSLQLSYSQAEKIKNRFLEIEKNFQGRDKINKQIQILKELKILPYNFSIDVLLSTLYNYNISSLPKFFFTFLKLTIGGPLIVSHLTLRGRIEYLFYLNSSFYHQFNISFDGNLNGSYIDGAYGLLRIYIGYAFKPVFVTIIGPKISGKSKNLLFPFFEILIPCTGFSVSFNYVTENSSPDILFEYNLDACLAGFIAGF